MMFMFVIEFIVLYVFVVCFVGVFIFFLVILVVGWWCVVIVYVMRVFIDIWIDKGNLIIKIGFCYEKKSMFFVRIIFYGNIVNREKWLKIWKK